MTATGPFTCTDDLSFAPLTELLAVAARRRPAALVLLGPFVDETHPSISSPELGADYSQTVAAFKEAEVPHP